jgi:hypothetical protein
MLNPPEGMPDTLPPESALGRLPQRAPSLGAVASGFVPASGDGP